MFIKGQGNNTSQFSPKFQTSYVWCTTLKVSQVILHWDSSVRRSSAQACSVLERDEECMCIIQRDQRLINSGHLILSSPRPPQFHSVPFYPTAQWPQAVAQDTQSFVKDLQDTYKLIPCCVCEAITRGRESFWQMSLARLSHTRSSHDSPPRIQRPGLGLQDYARKWRIWHQINKNEGVLDAGGKIVELLNPAWHWGGLLLFPSHRA